jgi:hypothetical protein
MKIMQTFELTMTLDTERFNKLKRRLNSNSGGRNNSLLVTEGISVSYHDKQYKKKVVLNVTPKWMLGDGEPGHSNLDRKLDEYISANIGSKYQLDDFRVTGMFLIADIDVHDRERVADYMKVLQRVGKVKGFSPLSDNLIGDDISFNLAGNSNGIEFWAYDLEQLLKKELDEAEYGRKQLKALFKKSEGLIRVEIRLTEMKAIRAYTNKTDNDKQMIELCKRSEKIFLDTFMRIVPFGNFLKKDEAAEAVKQHVEDVPIRRQMLRLLDLVPEKKSLHLAQKALNYRKLDHVMDVFAEIEVSPVTISKRHDVRRLE